MSHRIASVPMENKHIFVELKLESHIEYEMKQKMSINWLMKLEKFTCQIDPNDGKN